MHASSRRHDRRVLALAFCAGLETAKMIARAQHRKHALLPGGWHRWSCRCKQRAEGRASESAQLRGLRRVLEGVRILASSAATTAALSALVEAKKAVTADLCSGMFSRVVDSV